MNRTPSGRTFLRALGAGFGLALSTVLAGCFAATPFDGMALSPDRGTCARTDSADESMLLVPIVAATDYEFTQIRSVQLLEATNLEIQGYDLVGNDISTELTPVPPTLIDQVRSRGRGLTPTPDLTGTEPTNLAVLLRSSGNADGLAGGLRIEWSVGEPVYFQDEKFTIDVSTSCELDVP